MADKTKIQRTHQEDLDKNRSLVRIWVTYAATFYAFGVGACLLFLGDKKYFTEAKELYLSVLPIATGVITYWFASRQKAESSPDKITENQDGEKGNEKPEPSS